MRLPHCRPTVRRAMASIVVFAVCLAAVRGNYRARLYGDAAVVKVLPVADRTPEGMATHALRLVSPEILRRASLDPRLSTLHQPLRAADPDEVIGSSPGPTVYAHVDSSAGLSWVDSLAEGSAAEARSIALAVADAYIADQGASRVVPWTAGIPMRCEFHPKPLAEPQELAAAVALAVLASALVLVVPTEQLSLRQWMAVAVVVPIVSILVLELWQPFPPGSKVVDVVVGAVVSGAFGVGAVRRPWVFLAVALVVWAGAPVMHHGFNAVTLSAEGCVLAWIVGAPAGWVSRSVTKGRKASFRMSLDRSRAAEMMLSSRCEEGHRTGCSLLGRRSILSMPLLRGSL